MFENGSNNMVMPVSPMMGGYGNGFGGMSGIRGRSPMTGRFVSRDGYPMNDTSYTMAYNSNEGGTMAQLQRMRDNAKNEHERMEMEKLLNFAKNNLDNY